LAGSDEQCQRKLPQFVTLASCESGNQGGVVVPGASVAHDVHDGGVPVVVAAQFPLSFPGSTVFVKRLYERLLGGDDPRCALRETRRSMHAAARRVVGPVDWGAIVEYGALPSDLDNHVREAQVRALRQRIDSAMSSVDPLVVPEARGTISTAWQAANEGLTMLSSLRSDPEVDRYVSRANLRWAFILKNAIKMQSLRSDARTASTLEDGKPLSMSPDLCLRRFRDGLRRHWRVTHNPLSNVESIVGDFFMREPIGAHYLTSAFTECIESYFEARSKETKRKLERALVDLWIIQPRIEGVPFDWQRVSEALENPRIGNATLHAFIFDRQFADAPPTDYEYFASRREIARIRLTAESEPKPARPRMSASSQDRAVKGKRNRAARGKATDVELDMPKIAERAAQVELFLASRGVPEKFSAIVDWIDEPDGGRRTVAT
jgi:hypothetical protein